MSAAMINKFMGMLGLAEPIDEEEYMEEEAVEETVETKQPIRIGYFVNRFTTKKGWMRFNIGMHWFMFYCFSYNHPDPFVSDSRWFVLVLAIMMSVCIKLAFDKTKTIKEKIRYFFDYFKH
jgi:hypothetical protein